uniref:Uncharacterized protein n=1 Tax=Arundo donax TaxID=35708 RepID=A0A0A9BVI9_ARUDO
MVPLGSLDMPPPSNRSVVSQASPVRHWRDPRPPPPRSSSAPPSSPSVAWSSSSPNPKRLLNTTTPAID